MANFSLNASLDAELGQLRCFAGSCFSGNNNDLMLPDSSDDILGFSVDWQ